MLNNTLLWHTALTLSILTSTHALAQNQQTPDEPAPAQDKPTDQTPTKPICSPDALAVGIEHFAYDEVFAEDLVWSGFGDKTHENKLIHKDAYQPLQELVKAAAKDKVALYPSSIFRSVRAQEIIIKRKFNQKQPAKTIYYTSSPAGFSEHHTGYAVDFAPIDAKFAKTKGYQWLINHAHQYGWEQTFTPDYSAKSGVSEESWHWRYVGDERGQALFASRTCQEYTPVSQPVQSTEPQVQTPSNPKPQHNPSQAKSAQPKQNLTKSTQDKHAQTQQNQTKQHQTKSSQTKQNQTKPQKSTTQTNKTNSKSNQAAKAKTNTQPTKSTKK